MALVRIPTPLRKYTNNQDEVRVSAATVRDLIAEMEKQYPGIKERICDEKGQVRRFVKLFVGDEEIAHLQGEDTKLSEASEVSIVPAIAGGI